MTNRCGTVRGYFDHRKAGEPTCADCRQAKRTYELESRAARGTCSVAGCADQVIARSLCTRHWTREQRHGDATWEPPRRDDLFWSRVTPGATQPHMTDPCWIWGGSLGTKGYGKFGNPSELAHRYAFEQMVGGIPPGLTLDHQCRVITCVNPTHLDPVPRGVNATRQWEHYRNERQSA